MSLRLPSIYPITDAAISGLTHTEQVRRLASGGATLIQLRDKSASAREFFEEAAAAVNLGREIGVKIIINDRVDIALAAHADGVHLGQEDISPIEARRIMGADVIIGYSTHSVEQAQTAIGLPIDYLAFGPVFPTTTKANPDPVVGTGVIALIKRISEDLPLVAIGGIGPGEVAAVLNAGADSAAMISGLLHEPSAIADTYRKLVDDIANMNNIVTHG